MTITLRPYQQEAVDKIYQSWQSGNRNVCAVLPTGAGKSVCVSQIVYDGYRQGLSEAVIAHRNELVTQMSCHIAARGISHRIIGSDKTIAQAVRKHRDKFGKSFHNPSARTAVVGVDTLIARQKQLANWAQQIDRWTIDEFHHTIGGAQFDDNNRYVRDEKNNLIFNTNPNKWGKVVAMMPNAYGLGVTATPIRADGQGLGRNADGVADDLILGPSMRWLIDQGYLAEYEIVCPTSDLQAEDDKRSANGDWSSQYLKKKAKTSHIVGDVVENYMRFAMSRKAICFATDVETSNDIAEKFNAFGVRAASLSAKTPLDVREQALREFELGNITVLVNVDLFDEGFDVGDCEVCIMARPTASLGKYLQQIGRVLRPYPGKVALIIDHVSNLIRHKLPDMPRQWTLARRDKRAKSAPDPEDVPLSPCINPICVKPYPRHLVCCPYCGTEKPLPAPRERNIEMVEGDLVLLDRSVLERMRSATQLESAADIAERVGYASGNPIAAKAAANRQIEKIEEHGRLCDAMAQWAGIERAKGSSDREIQKKFYITVGYDVLSALDASKPRADMEKIRTMIENWYAPR